MYATLTITTTEQAEELVKGGVLKFEGDLIIKVKNFVLHADIDAHNIKAENIDVWEIKACCINAQDIWAWNIYAWDIDARDISYYAVCFTHFNIVCRSIKGRRENARHFVLDGRVIIDGNEESIKGEKK